MNEVAAGSRPGCFETASPNLGRFLICERSEFTIATALRQKDDLALGEGGVVHVEHPLVEPAHHARTVVPERVVPEDVIVQLPFSQPEGVLLAFRDIGREIRHGAKLIEYVPLRRELATVLLGILDEPVRLAVYVLHLLLEGALRPELELVFSPVVFGGLGHEVVERHSTTRAFSDPVV